METARPLSKFGSQGVWGLLLVAVCWPLNWTLPGERTAYLFFPLWLGYILVMDALVCARAGTSLWMRSRRGFVLLFIISAPAWWLFEIINNRTGNWEYLGAGGFTPLEYNVLSTLSFSTVMPAVFETAELVRTFRWVKWLRPCGRIGDSRNLNGGMFVGGLAMLTAKFFYPCVWISLVLILEPINRMLEHFQKYCSHSVEVGKKQRFFWVLASFSLSCPDTSGRAYAFAQASPKHQNSSLPNGYSISSNALGRQHLLQWLERGDWRPVISLSLGALICGFFWEMWNEWSWPQWIYHTPGVNFLHVFKMPLPGYGGYLPFGLELFALKNFIWPRGPKLEL